MLHFTLHRSWIDILQLYTASATSLWFGDGVCLGQTVSHRRVFSISIPFSREHNLSTLLHAKVQVISGFFGNLDDLLDFSML